MLPGDSRHWHPWLRVSLLIRAMLTTRWDSATWQQIKAEWKAARDRDVRGLLEAALRKLNGEVIP